MGLFAGADALLVRLIVILIVLAVPDRHWGRLRGIAIIAFAAIFVLAGKESRKAIVAGFATAADFLRQHSPYSYIGLVVAGFVLLFVLVVRGDRPKSDERLDIES